MIELIAQSIVGFVQIPVNSFIEKLFQKGLKKHQTFSLSWLRKCMYPILLFLFPEWMRFFLYHLVFSQKRKGRKRRNLFYVEATQVFFLFSLFFFNNSWEPSYICLAFFFLSYSFFIFFFLFFFYFFFFFFGILLCLAAISSPEFYRCLLSLSYFWGKSLFPKSLLGRTPQCSWKSRNKIRKPPKEKKRRRKHCFPPYSFGTGVSYCFPFFQCILK